MCGYDVEINMSRTQSMRQKIEVLQCEVDRLRKMLEYHGITAEAGPSDTHSQPSGPIGPRDEDDITRGGIVSRSQSGLEGANETLRIDPEMLGSSFL